MKRAIFAVLALLVLAAGGARLQPAYASGHQSHDRGDHDRGDNNNHGNHARGGEHDG